MTQARDPIDITPRKVAFDWSGVPLHFIPDEPFASHGINALHILLPAGENWFCKVYAEAIPYLDDAPQLKKDAMAFMRQEAMHSRAHQAVQAYFAENGIETRGMTDYIEKRFDRDMGEKVFGLFTPRSERMKRWWLAEKLAVIAAIEHFTCVLSVWLFEQSKLKDAGADPTMLDLFHWHCAEEIEHRNVAFDLALHMSGGSHWPRWRGMITTVPMFYYLIRKCHAELRRQDPHFRRQGRVRFMQEWKQAEDKGLLPGFAWAFKTTFRWFTKKYDPNSEADTQTALDYFKTSPVLARMG